MGERIRHARLGAGLTQYELAERAGISQATVSHIESGRRHPRITTVALMAGVLGVTPAWLLGTTMTPDRLTVSVAEAAQMLGVGRNAVYGMIRAGTFPHVRVGRLIRVPVAGLHAWLGAGEGNLPAPFRRVMSPDRANVG